MEIKGKVHEIGEVEQITDTFRKRELIVEYAENPQFVEYLKFEATQDRVSIFDNVNVGDEVEVSFNLRGRPWTGKDGVTKYFNSLIAWRITKLESQATPPPPTPGLGDVPPAVDISSSGNDDDDDLPF